MSAFDPVAICPKCAHDVVRVIYQRRFDQYACRAVPDHAETPYGEWDTDEHFHRRCERCNYGWREEVLS
jgi:hypothetical protein